MCRQIAVWENIISLASTAMAAVLVAKPPGENPAGTLT
jgi:hypothetical protein